VATKTKKIKRLGYYWLGLSRGDRCYRVNIIFRIGGENTKIKQFTIKDLAILPAQKGTCPTCAVKHDPRMPHNKDSLFYQMSFYQEHERWPTWVDAMGHCTPDVKEWMISALKTHGIDIEKSAPAVTSAD